MHQNNNLVGSTISHVWTTGPWVPSGYNHELLTDTQLRWTGISGKRTGLSDRVTYEHVAVSPQIHQFSWIEESNDNLHKVLVYNFERLTVDGVLFNSHHAMYVLHGVMTDTAGTPLKR